MNVMRLLALFGLVAQSRKVSAGSEMFTRPSPWGISFRSACVEKPGYVMLLKAEMLAAPVSTKLGDSRSVDGSLNFTSRSIGATLV